jgi:hypothetical protein
VVDIGDVVEEVDGVVLGLKPLTLFLKDGLIPHVKMVGEGTPE